MGILPNIAFALVAASFAVRDILWLRCLAMLASAVAISYDVQQLVTDGHYRVPNLVWHSLFLLINAYQVWRLVYGERHVRLREEEQVLYDNVFSSLTKLEFEKLLSIARWEDAASGTVLCEQGGEIDDVMLIRSGGAIVEVGGEHKADLHEDQFIGEMSFVTGEPVSATVRVTDPLRFVAWSKPDLRHMLRRNPSIRFALLSIMGIDLSHKLNTGPQP